MASRRRTIRSVLAALVFLSAATLVVGYVDAERTNDKVTGDPSVEQAFKTGNRSPVVPSRPNVTVVATDSNAFVGDEGDGARARAELAAFAPDGSIYYYQDNHTRYWDVDRVPGTNSTVEFVYADHLAPGDCGETVCTQNGVERVNLTTGERTQVYSRVTPGKHSTRWHDVDRIDEHRLLVADIDRDRVYVVNTTTELIEWEWDAQSDFDVAESGGPFPDDWTHLNDVEYVEVDGQEAVMVSLRNHDQVAFVSFERGLMENWTLGTDGDHSTLYEQHNPDYIPPENGGPAVLVADSENGRVVEYQRENGEWNRTWTWADQRVQWPRDADRLPNGNTLVTDSNGDRVFEVNSAGEVVWSATVGFPYESERLGTGDESEGGESAASLGVPSKTPAEGERSLLARATAALPPKVVNSIAYAFPRWVGVVEGLAVAVLTVSLVRWLTLEYRWTDRTVGVRSPLRFGRK
ncbi:arylsulfotransferase family protein [Halopelagius longus]|uniref:Arylsulfotransferase (Asst) n=1 Tax=Halopelagius longus TaxID=1236180 RepID=A0A1H1G864_9EURY|nr:arylsulfotransferase family protein [Halopelagius longus]RDI69802.1 arylsulfotransferase (asst) [Halopelagius longus]SDR08996.1 Arylsulfotransferase (ASST) [Halopelagius longus]